jgi:hypothetical protein
MFLRMKLKLFISLFLLVITRCYCQYDIDAYFFPDNDRKNIKQITEKSRSKWKTVSIFDEKGFLLHRINYYKDKKMSDYKHEYEITDTLINVKVQELVNINNNPESYSIYKYYFNLQRQCYKHEKYSSTQSLNIPFVVTYNLVYEDTLLKSYETMIYNTYKQEYVPSDKINYIYNIKNKKIQEQRCSGKDTTYYTYIYNSEGLQTDYIIKSSDKFGVFTEVLFWSLSERNRIECKYDNFNKKSHWTKSYFMTEKGKKFRSKRKIKYWK